MFTIKRGKAEIAAPQYTSAITHLIQAKIILDL